MLSALQVLKAFVGSFSFAAGTTFFLPASFFERLDQLEFNFAYAFLINNQNTTSTTTGRWSLGKYCPSFALSIKYEFAFNLPLVKI